MDGIGIGIAGCGGRMGRMLVAQLATTPGARLTGGIDAAPGLLGTDIAALADLDALGITVGDDPGALLQASDVVIDFTVPAASAALAGEAADAGTALVVGTTGLDPAQTAAIERAARTIPIVWAANFSVGVNLLLGLVEQVAHTLGPDYDIEVVEMHHRLKIDAPSGTALALGRAAAQGRGRALEELWVKSRDGQTGQRDTGAIGFAALRGGDVVGDHTVMFAGAGERLELIHRASDRSIFARGAIRAALWVTGKPPGLYGMKDVLGL